MCLIETKNLACYIEGNPILKHVNLKVKSGQFIGIIGANGSGKSTLIRHLNRLLPCQEGEILLEGKNLAQFSTLELAKQMALVHQNQEVPFDFSVEEIVGLGRFPHKSLLSLDNVNDQAIIHQALREVGMEEEAKRPFHHLSGGQQQRVLIAKALAQETPLILLDEPTNHLDIQYKLQIFQLLKKLPITVITALHDLNIAALFCDELYVLHQGGCPYHGTPQQILTTELIQEVFGVSTKITHQPFTIAYEVSSN